MRWSRIPAIAGAVAFTATAAVAADMPVIQQAPVCIPASQVVGPTNIPICPEVFSAWYLRGDIGLAQQKVRRLDNALYRAPGVRVSPVGMGFDSAPTFGAGIGYMYNNWLRFDLTGEYRGRANFHGLDIVRVGGVPNNTDEYRASKSEWLFLANGYVDLGTWSGITPFVGAGLGYSYNKIHSFIDVCTTCPGGGVAVGSDVGKWNFAWAIHAGLAYKVNQNFTVELAYRYLSLGNARSGDLRTWNGINNVNNPMHFKGLTSHDVRLGVRWSFDGFDFPVFAPRPVYHSAPVYQAPVYSPPPVYAPPPAYTPPPTYAPAPVYSPPPAYSPPPVYAPQYQQPLQRRG
jgi:opacity protein-like surface antigen